jgi:hypothetical protein
MTLLVAVILDGNNEALPIAWRIVPGECEEHWSWFLAHLRQAFPSMSGPTLVVISDRKKGLEGTMAQNFSIVQHCHSCEHLADNVQARYSMACRMLFLTAAFAILESAFKEVIREIGEEKAACKTYLEGIPPRRWATYACRGPRYNHMMSNMVEAINTALLETRKLPQLLLLANL